MIDAMKMALHALKFSQNMKRCFARAEQDYHEKIAPIAIETLRQAIEQAEKQEPVAWMEMVVANLVRNGINKHMARELAHHFYTYTAPPKREWVGLTDEVITSIAVQHQSLKQIAKAIEQYLKDNNHV